MEPTMAVNINYRGCGFVRGWFTVEDIAYQPATCCLLGRDVKAV